MIGKDLGALRPSAPTARSTSETAPTPVYAADGIARKGALAPTDIEIHKGEVVGFAGLLGSGRTELARLIVGADKPDAGTVPEGQKASITSPVSGLANHIAYSTENRRDDGIVGDLSIRENIMLAVQARADGSRRVPAKEVDRLVTMYMERFSVRPNDPDRPIRLLSGGNQQKVLLGRWLATDPELLLLDEPTRGIDVGAKADIQETVAELAEGGMSVVFISSELEEVVRLSERIVIMKDHQKVGEVVNGPDVTAERIVSIIAADSEPPPKRTRTRSPTRSKENRHDPSEGARTHPLVLGHRGHRPAARAEHAEGPVLPGDRGQPDDGSAVGQPSGHPAGVGADRDDRARHDLRHRHQRHRPVGRLRHGRRRRGRDGHSAVWASPPRSVRCSPRSGSPCCWASCSARSTACSSPSSGCSRSSARSS
jgi:simple sugar transport system ATP-binding protein